ncbi:GAF domain-containing protein [Alteribacillus persepolensis]|uniref:GAF domain-containing protein n=1 Tax=Alteribacillus persepolensis TaxID=568899 RepID=A0A1G8GWB8_9BACI|nr:helix-turn-helix domain-containing protein [Alteribacillus persepolensis]SDH98698.1 GAF domain-containing protein [Alteribacillus persepolensis]
MSQQNRVSHYKKTDYQKTQHDLTNLMESFRVISSTLNLEEVLKKIMRYALSIFKTANAGYIQLYDEKSHQLVVKAYTGFNEHIKHFRVNAGESITGKVFRDGAVKLLYTEKEINANMLDLSEENAFFIEKAQCLNQTIKSLMSVPVSFGSKRIGVMTLHCFDNEKGHSKTDLLLLQSFTSQAAIAIHNAQMHAEVQTNLEEITSLSEKLKEVNSLLAKRTETHNLLTRLSIQNKGLDVILSKMNHLMEKNIYYADYLEGKLSSPMQDPVIEYLDDLFLLFQHRTNPAYVWINKEHRGEYYVYPLHSGSTFLGCLITEENSTLSELDHIVLEQGAPILSLEIMKKRSQTEIRYKKTYEQYQQFLKTKNHKQAELLARDLGIYHYPFLQTAIIELEGDVNAHSLENDALLLLAHLKKRVAAHNTLLFSYNNKITFFASSPASVDEKHISDMIQASITWWNERYPATARAGISSGHYRPGQAQENQDKAEQALLHLKKQMKKGCLHYRDIGISRLFIHHSTEEIDTFLQEVFGTLWLDKEKNNDLLYTLMAYVKNNRSMSTTAKELHIHTNTLYHRIKKAENLLHMNFDHYEDYLSIQLAVYLFQTFQQ